jgi:UDP-3-O-[3-hydroxymyristoyl] glucosamine N-acyltransferase
MTLEELAALVQGEFRGPADTLIRGAASIERVEPDEITLADGAKLLPALIASSAAAVVVTQNLADINLPRIIVRDVHKAFSQIVAHFRPPRTACRVGLSPSASIAASAQIAEDVDVHSFASIGEDVVIESGCVIHSGVHIMAGCHLGRDVTLFPNVVLYEGTQIGDRSIVHAGAIIGAYGFGYHTEDGRHVRSAQLGNVRVGCDVEIGAGTTIDRGTYDATVIGDGTKIDNQVMIGHNVRLGRHNLICSQVGIAGSCTTGDYVVLAGQVGLSDHLHIGNQAIIGAKAGVMNDVPVGAVYIGVPATPERDQWRMWGHVRQLPNMRRQLKKLEQQLERLGADLAESPEVAEDSDDRLSAA